MSLHHHQLPQMAHLLHQYPPTKLYSIKLQKMLMPPRKRTMLPTTNQFQLPNQLKINPKIPLPQQIPPLT
jgi:hypothetical protein